MDIKINNQKASQTHWTDETGQQIPINRILPIEKLKEQTTAKIVKKAIAINGKLTEFKKTIAEICQKVYDEAMKDTTAKNKGNFTFHNFDMSIKVEVSINEQIDFDSLLIEQAKAKLDEMICESITKDKEFIKELVMSAFQNSNGKLDTKKVLSLKKHSQRIKDSRYHEAMELIDNSIRRPSSKTYFRVWIKDEAGKYQNIDLNFSSIQA